MKHQLAPDDRQSLDGPLPAAGNDQAAEKWIANHTGTAGPPLRGGTGAASLTR